MRIKYNIIIFAGRAFLVLFFLTILFALLALTFTEGRLDKAPMVIFFLVVLSYFITSFTKSIFKETYDLIIEKEQLTLVRPILGNTSTIDIKTVEGFTTSQIKYGSDWGRGLFKANSVILYSHTHFPIEFIQYNYRSFDKIKEKFQELGITYLGHEKYQTGLFSRKYKF